MRKIILLFGVIFCASVLYAQDSDKYIEKYDTIRDDTYKGTNIQNELKRHQKFNINKIDGLIRIGTGMCIPTGDLKTFGIEFEAFVIGLGLRYNRSLLSIEGGVAPKMKSEPFVVHSKKTGEDILSSECSKVEANIGYSYDILCFRRNWFTLFANVGYGGLSVYRHPKDENGNVYVENAASLVLSAGVGYNVCVSRTVLVGIRAKYNYCDFSSSGRVDFKGNYFTVHLIFEFMDGGFW